MTLIVLLISLLLVRLTVFFSQEARFSGWRLYRRKLNAFLQRIFPNWDGIRLLLILIIPVGLVAWLSDFLNGHFWSLGWAVLSLFTLVWCLDYESIYELWEKLIEENTLNDFSNLKIVRQLFVPKNFYSEMEEHDNHILIKEFFYQFETRLFGVIFWFVIGGPFGALTYRLVAEVALTDDSEYETDSALQATALGFLALLDWIPIRLMSLGFALTGSFDQSIVPFFHDIWGRGESLGIVNRRLLADCALAAIWPNGTVTATSSSEDQAIFDKFRRHIRRNMIAWLTVIALVTLGGWLF